MNNKLVLLVLFLTVFFIAPFLLAAEAKKGHFYWAFVRVDENENSVPVTEEQTTGEISKHELKIFFQPMVHAYLYLLLFGPEENLTLVFPDNFNDFNKCYDTFKRMITVITPRAMPGDYELHILVSADRLKTLEEMLNKYSNRELLLKKKRKYNNGLLALIQKIKRDSRLPSISQAKFNSEGSVNRIEEGILNKYVKKYEFKGLYTKIYQFKKKQ
jgi:hypothetical protein